MMANFGDVSQQCRNFAVPTLCYYAFPVCDATTGLPRKLCRDECELLEREVCKLEFQLAREHHLLGEYGSKLAFFP